MTNRQYLPTLAQLIDRLCIVTLKSIKIPKNKVEYEKEAKEIMHDIDMVLESECAGMDNVGQFIRAIIMNAIANETIWANESKAREGKSDQDALLKFTHSVNGVRSQAMNVISNIIGERLDLKVDCLAAENCKQNGYDFGGVL